MKKIPKTLIKLPKVFARFNIFGKGKRPTNRSALLPASARQDSRFHADLDGSDGETEPLRSSFGYLVRIKKDFVSCKAILRDIEYEKKITLLYILCLCFL